MGSSRVVETFKLADTVGVSRATVSLEQGPKRWHVAEYVYAPDRQNDHSLISIDDFPNETEARKDFDFRKKSEQDKQERYKKERRSRKAS